MKISIVEDREELRNGLKSLLETAPGYQCEPYSTAETAIHNINDGNTDVILMDIDLPGISGIEATKILKKKYPDLQIIILTVFENPDKIFPALKAGATGYLLKNSAPSAILDSISDVMNGGSPMSREIARMVVGSFNSKIETTHETDSLSKREAELLELLSKGYRYKDIADALFISTNTVRTHIRNIYEKLQVQSKIEAINKMNKG
jgi:DNA-binding NarL/FixJ family response regulator